MIQFSPFRTPRLTVQLRELDIGQIMDLAARPDSQYEATLTAMLDCAIVKPERSGVGQVDDPRQWTVQERGMVAAHYMAHVAPEPDFKIGNTSFSKYLYEGAEVVEPLFLGSLCEDEWTCYPLLGYQAESIERLVNGGRLVSGRRGFMLAAMACQMLRPNDDTPGDLPDAQYDNWLLDRVQVFSKLPDSYFSTMLMAYMEANHKLQHLLQMAFNDEGAVFVTGVPGDGPARFPVSDLISDGTAAFLGLLARPDNGPDPVQPPAVSGGAADDALPGA